MENSAIAADSLSSAGYHLSLNLPFPVSAAMLFIHGTADTVVPVEMSQQLYQAVPGSKQILLVPRAGHFRLYQPGANSYLKAIQRFVETIE